MKRKHYLVIGGTRGIGRIIAQSIGKKNHTLSVIGRRSPITTDRKRENVHYWLLDISQKKKLASHIHNIIEHNGKISHLIFCQRYRGANRDWDGELNVSLTATKKIIELVSDYFDDTLERSIVIISSIASSLVALEQPVSYHVAKAGLNHMVRYFAVVLGPKGIRVNSISPSTVLKDESKEYYIHNKKLQNLYKHIIPLGRMGTAQEISDIVMYLCSPTSSYITGQNIIADGGISLLSHEALARSLTSLTHEKL